MYAMRKVGKRVLSFMLILIMILGLGPDKLSIVSEAAGSDAGSMLKALDIVALDGKTYHVSDFKEDYVVFLFGRSSCEITGNMANAAVACRKSGISVKIVLMDIDDTDAGLAKMAKDLGLLASLNPSYNNNNMWAIGRKSGVIWRNDVVLPVTFVLDSDRNLIYAHDDNDSFGLKRALGYIFSASDAGNVRPYQYTMTYGQSEMRETLKDLNEFRTSPDAWYWNETNTEKIICSGLKELQYDYGLERVAMQRAAELVISFSHFRPDGGLCFTAFPANYSGFRGENIAKGNAMDSMDALIGWEEEDFGYERQGHRRNMLKSTFGYVGFGHVCVNGYDYYVQVFSSTPVDLTPSAANDSDTAVTVNVNPEIADPFIPSYNRNSFAFMSEAEFISKPQRRTLYYNGTAQELVTAGTASGGTVVYALKTGSSAPGDDSYSPVIPTATEEGTYYVYYKIRPDEGHFYSGYAMFSVTIKPAKDDPGNNSGNNSGNNNGNNSGNNTESPDYISGLNCKWNYASGKAYWYEGGYKQGTYKDSNGVLGDGSIRGREIYDGESNGWYWLDSVYNGAKAEGKEVWIPYIYQDELVMSSNGLGRYANGISDDAKIRELAQLSNTYEAEMADQVEAAIRNHTGKWVRYDEKGAMLKGWVTIEGNLAICYPSQIGNVYYYDQKTGLMAKGWTRINGKDYYFDEITGVLQK